MNLACPWEMDSSQIEIVDGYEAQIVAEDGEEYAIEFHDENMDLVESSIMKSEFINHPIQPAVGTHFGLIIFRQKTVPGICISAWPLKSHWHSSLRIEDK